LPYWLLSYADFKIVSRTFLLQKAAPVAGGRSLSHRSYFHQPLEQMIYALAACGAGIGAGAGGCWPLP
jgi:hypothetical protein